MLTSQQSSILRACLYQRDGRAGPRLSCHDSTDAGAHIWNGLSIFTFILCSFDRASLYNLVNETNLVHNILCAGCNPPSTPDS